MRDAVHALKSRQPVNLAIVGINILIYILPGFFGESARDLLLREGAAYTPLIVWAGQYYRLFTSMFLHFSVSHLLNNMFILFFLGDELERFAGKLRYLVIYLGGGLIGNLVSMAWDLHTGEAAMSAGASGAIFAVIGALVAMVLLNRGRVPHYTQRRMFLMAALCVLQGLTSAGVDNAAHIGGIAGGFLLALLFHRKLRFQEPERIPVEMDQE